MRIIRINTESQNKNECYIFFNGAYQMASKWVYIAKKIQELTSCDIFLIEHSINGEEDKCSKKDYIKLMSELILKETSNYKNINIIGHSLGSVVVCNIIEYIYFHYNSVNLYLSCVPIGINMKLINLRQKISDMIIWIGEFLPIDLIPLKVKGYFLISYRKNDLIYLVNKENIEEKFENINKKINVNIGYSSMDPYLRNYKYYNNIVENLKNKNINAKLKYFGISFHAPQFFRKSEFINWIAN